MQEMDIDKAWSELERLFRLYDKNGKLSLVNIALLKRPSNSDVKFHAAGSGDVDLKELALLLKVR